MAAKKPYEMSFAEFAEAIRPSWGISVASPFKPTATHSEWLTSIWDSAEKRCTYSTFWSNDALKNELPLEAQKYQFDDLSLFPITARLGLDPESDEDNSKAADVLALRNAWITSIQHHYRVIDFKYYQWGDLRTKPDPDKLNDSEKKFFLGVAQDGILNLSKSDIAKSWGYAQSVMRWHNEKMLGEKISIDMEFWLPSDRIFKCVKKHNKTYSAGELHAKPITSMIDELLKHPTVLCD